MNQPAHIVIIGAGIVGAAIGMAIGYGWYAIAVACTIYSIVVPRIPHLSKWGRDQDP